MHMHMHMHLRAHCTCAARALHVHCVCASCALLCALQVGVLLPSSQAEVAEAVAQVAGSRASGLASLLQQTLPADADPSLVLVQLQQASTAPLPLAPRAGTRDPARAQASCEGRSSSVALAADEEAPPIDPHPHLAVARLTAAAGEAARHGQNTLPRGSPRDHPPLQKPTRLLGAAPMGPRGAEYTSPRRLGADERALLQWRPGTCTRPPIPLPFGHPGVGTRPKTSWRGCKRSCRSRSTSRKPALTLPHSTGGGESG